MSEKTYSEKEMQKVEVDWLDAQSSLDYWSIEELKKIKEKDLAHTKSCGYLVHKDKVRLILCFMLFGQDGCKHHQVIPMGMVKKITELHK